mmetsp:Transcript_5624/g.13202  ORF Transcript_5624/g.13202 Transcript_5624/m.13202 type:complete len:470 (+) Transcript_5624:211-1620(+)
MFEPCCSCPGPSTTYIAMTPQPKKSATAADAPGFSVRPLTKEDVESFMGLTDEVGWTNTKFDVEYLLGRKDSKAFGVFTKDKKMVSVAAVSLMEASQQPKEANARDVAWLSYVITAKDYRRQGLARRVCSEALKWLDSNYPSTPIGLYGEKEKAAPLYADIGFKDVGKTQRWTTKVDPQSLLRSDGSIKASADGKLEIPAFVDQITMGSCTAVLVSGKELTDQVCRADVAAFGGDRGKELRAWSKRYPDLCWMVKSVNSTKVGAVFERFSNSPQGGNGKILSYEGFKALSLKTEGVEVSEKQFRGYCRKSGADGDQGMSLQSLFQLYSLPGNDIDKDYAKVTGQPLPDSASSVRGYVFGRATKDKGYFLGPLWSRDQECAGALLLAAVRGGCVIQFSNNRQGLASFELMNVEIGVGDNLETSASKAQVLRALGFKKGGGSRFMVRNGDEKSFYRADASNTYAASSYEFA